MAIGRSNTTRKLNDVVATFLSEYMRWKNMEGSTPEELSLRGRYVSKKKGKPSSGRYKSRGKLRL